MIEFFRRASESLIARIFFGFLALSFALMWGGQEGLRMIGMNRDATVATVGKETISNRDLAMAIERVRLMARAESGQDLTADQIRATGLDRQLLETLIADALVRQEADKLGISVSDDYVRDSLRSQQAFLRADGTFSRDTFMRFIQNFGFRSEKEYVDHLKSEILRGRLIRALSANASLPLVAADPLFSWNEQVRTAELMLINPSAQKLQEQPTEDDLRDFYGKNQKQFFAPERRTFKALIIPESIVPVSVSESDIKTVYEIEKDRKYKGVKVGDAKDQIRAQLKREAVQAGMIDKATAIQEAFEEGKSLRDIATEKKYEFMAFEDEAQTLKGNRRLPLQQTLVDVAFGISEGELSPLEEISGQRAYGLVYLESRKDPAQLAFADAMGDVKGAYIKQKQQDLTKEMIEKIEVDLKAGDDFKAVAKKYGLKTSLIKASRQKILAPFPKALAHMRVQNLFAVPVGGLTVVPYDHEFERNIAVAKINAKNSGSPQKDPTGFEAFKGNLERQTQNDMYQLFVTDLRSRYTVEVNKRYFEN